MKQFTPVPKETIEALKAAGDAIMDEAVEKSMLQSNEIKHHPENPRPKIVQGFQFTHNMLLTAAQTGQPDLLKDQANWAVNRLPHDDIQIPFLLNRLEYYRDALRSHLSESDVDALEPFLDTLIVEIKKNFS